MGSVGRRAERLRRADLCVSSCSGGRHTFLALTRNDRIIVAAYDFLLEPCGQQHIGHAKGHPQSNGSTADVGSDKRDLWVHIRIAERWQLGVPLRWREKNPSHHRASEPLLTDQPPQNLRQLFAVDR